MTREHKGYAVFLITALAATWFLVKNSSSGQVDISVGYDTNNQLVLNLRNTTTHQILVESLRVNPSKMGFHWEMYLGEDPVAQGNKPTIKLNPLMPVSYSPVVISPDDPFEVNLAIYYQELADKDLLKRADTLLWYCRVWNETAKTWVQANGSVRLKRH